MKNIHDQKGSVFLDVIAAMFIMTLTGIIVFNSVFFNLKMQSALKDMDRMNSAIEDEIIMLTDSEGYSERTAEGYDISSYRKYAGTVNGTDFYEIRIDISHEGSEMRRSYEILIHE